MRLFLISIAVLLNGCTATRSVQPDKYFDRNGADWTSRSWPVRFELHDGSQLLVADVALRRESLYFACVPSDCSRTAGAILKWDADREPSGMDVSGIVKTMNGGWFSPHWAEFWLAFAHVTLPSCLSSPLATIRTSNIHTLLYAPSEADRQTAGPVDWQTGKPPKAQQSAETTVAL